MFNVVVVHRPLIAFWYVIPSTTSVSLSVILQGTRMGTEAVLALMEATPTSPPVVIALSGNQTVRVPLMQCVEKTLAVAQAMGAKRFKEAQELRGRSFKGNLETYIRLSKLRPKVLSSKQVSGKEKDLAHFNRFLCLAFIQFGRGQCRFACLRCQCSRTLDHSLWSLRRTQHVRGIRWIRRSN